MYTYAAPEPTDEDKDEDTSGRKDAENEQSPDDIKDYKKKIGKKNLVYICKILC